MDPFTHVAIVAHFMAGNCVELIPVDAIPPSDPEDGDAQYALSRPRQDY
jgi:hypothetical protein